MRQGIGRITSKLILIFIFIFCFSFYIPAYAETGDTSSNAFDSDYLQSITDMIKEKYNGQPTNDQLMQGALKGVFDSMDPYTTFFTKEEAESFFGSVSGSYSGIGITMELSGDYVIVSKVFPNSPAEKAGLIQGDKISEVNGKSIIGASLEEAQALIMGEIDTKVKLGIIRNSQDGVITFELTRQTIKVNPVTYEIVNGIAYIKLDMFNSNAGSGLAEALNEIDKNKITKVVLDLRGNPGGEVSQAIEVARNFVPSGLITRLDYKSSSYSDQPYYSYLQAPKYKLALLVNGSSASASEIVAGAIQDTKAGTLIGTKTFGKAKFQTLIPLLTPEASAKYQKQTGTRIVDVYDLEEKYGIVPTNEEIIGYTKMTVGFYYTPNDRLIDGIGITPDIVVQAPATVAGIDPTSIQRLTRTFKPGLNGEGSDVLNTERILRILGYDVSTPDTKLDTKTFKAITKFQKDEKLFPYGVLDYTTQKALNTKLDGIILKYDKQFAKAVEILNK
jgi:C-terminal peptidase (prc)